MIPLLIVPMVLAQTPPAAIGAPLQPRAGSPVSGDVRVTPQGSGSTIQIRISGPAAGLGRPTLVRGSDCAEAARRAATALPLNPISGGVSRTVVAIPFSAFRSGRFAVDVRRATGAAQAAEACARL